MPLVTVRMAQELPPGSVVEVRVGAEIYALCNVDGHFHCVGGRCPHMGGPLGQGMLCGTRLMCPWHGWEFECATGANCDGGDPIDSYPVVVRDGWVCIETPEPLAAPDTPRVSVPA